MQSVTIVPVDSFNYLAVCPYKPPPAVMIAAWSYNRHMAGGTLTLREEPQKDSTWEVIRLGNLYLLAKRYPYPSGKHWWVYIEVMMGRLLFRTTLYENHSQLISDLKSPGRFEQFIQYNKELFTRNLQETEPLSLLH